MTQLSKETIFQWDFCPRRQLSKKLFSNNTVVQVDYYPMGHLSKEAFTSKKLVQIDFSYVILDINIIIDYILKKNYVNSLQYAKVSLD